ncbi:PTS sugar transporter subunit IIB [Vibrio ruber]|uniref:PTS sugar transporter subunit IIB n=1 Tax=Vibrio ruber TaxID=184755 RepID=UPI002892DB6C|nr:PTS sugar transporter subunit IIB [Vibrio ruber]WNJ94285.1 PTS sugar transporter subunit IIB [Vibrio ruber]
MTTKIFLCCAAGMSTSMVVNNMLKAAKERNIDVEIKAYSISEFEDVVNQYDICLVAPQVSYKFNDFNKRCEEEGKKCAKINMMLYGTLNGDEILTQALALKSS